MCATTDILERRHSLALFMYRRNQLNVVLLLLLSNMYSYVNHWIVSVLKPNNTTKKRRTRTYTNRKHYERNGNIIILYCYNCKRFPPATNTIIQSEAPSLYPFFSQSILFIITAILSSKTTK